MAIEIRMLRSGDEAVLADVADGVFDYAVDPHRAVEFLNDPRHHLVVAMDAGVVVGFASAVHYVHPDKPPQLWINEVGVAPTYRRRGIAAELLQALFKVGRSESCSESWVLADATNSAAMGLYATQGGVPKHQVMFTFPLKEDRA